MIDYLKIAAEAAIPTNEIDYRNFWIGAVGVRKDGAVVSSRNGAAIFSDAEYQSLPAVHAEWRLTRKIDKGSTVYVARVARKDKSLAMSRPCAMCRAVLKSHNVAKVYYTVNSFQYGLWLPNSDRDVFFSKG